MRAMLVLLALLVSVPARAEWLEASSANFVIYADDSERDVRTFANQLERYHAGMAWLGNLETLAPSPSNRVTVYVVGSEEEVRRLHGGNSRNVAGFYRARAGGSLAIVPRLNAANVYSEIEFPMIVLLHEYAHHFLISSNPFAMPRWEQEGAAEFFASAKFLANGGLQLGRPAQHRAVELTDVDVSVEQLLDPSTYKPTRGYDGYYGKAWLLFHYLTFNEQRRPQLAKYHQLLIQGRGQQEAALEAFGPIKQLQKELNSYQRRPQMQMIGLGPDQIPVGAVNIRRLTSGEAAMMPVRVRSQRGVDREEATELLSQARRIAGQYPRDAAVLAALAEAEHDAGNDQAAIAAADAALTLDPQQRNAYVQKGLSLMRLASIAKTEAAYRLAREPFSALNRLEPNHPVPLIQYYRSFEAQGLKPTQLAVQGLMRAVDLAPFDLGLRMTLALQQISTGNLTAARRHLATIAFNPHGGTHTEAARRVVARIDSDPNWDGRSGLAELLNGAGEKDDDAGPEASRR